MSWVPMALALAVLCWPPATPPWRRPIRRVRPAEDGGAVSRASWPAPGSLAMRGRRARDRRRRSVITEMLRSLEPATRAGVPPAVALGAAAQLAARGSAADPAFAEALGDLAAAAIAGDDVPARLRRLAVDFDLPEVSVAAASWSLSEDLGGSLGAATTTALGLLEAQDQRDRAVRAALAGPRATMQLLTGLPLAGIAIAALVGVSPARLYAGVLGAASLTIGVTLLVLGRWWSGRLIRRALLSPRLT